MLLFSPLASTADPISLPSQFGVYEWCMTDEWDPKNAHHKDVAHGIEVGDGIPEMRSIKACRDALNNVGVSGARGT